MALSDAVLGGVNVARGLIRPTAALDVVAITTFGGFLPVFSNARPLMATVFEGAELMEHPLENGSVIADHIVYKPTEIELPLLCIGDAAYRSTYALIRAAFQTGQRLTIRTRTGVYPSMVIAELPHQETAEIFDGIAIRLRLREARIVTPKYGLAPAQVKSPAQASTVARGAQQAAAPAAATATAATATAATSGAGAAPQGSQLYKWAFG